MPDDARHAAGIHRLLFSFFIVAACEAQTPLGQRPSLGPFPEDYEVRPLAAAAAEPGWLIRVREGQHEIRHFAVLGDTVLFVARWEGVYRVDTTQGTVTALDTDSNADWGPIAPADNEAWYWVKSTYGQHDAPDVQFRRSAPLGLELRTVFHARWGVLWGGDQVDYYVDATGMYVAAHEARAPDRLEVRRIPSGGGTPAAIFLLSENGHTPSWLIDDNRVYVTDCPTGEGGPFPCTVYVASKTEPGPRQMVATLDTLTARTATGRTYPEPNIVLLAADATDLYLRSFTRVVKLPKAGGAPTVLVTAAVGTSVSGSLLIDPDTVYFLEMGRTGNVHPRAVPKQGGPVAAVGNGAGFTPFIRQMAQDERHLYLLWRDREILVQPKAAVASPTHQPGGIEPRTPSNLTHER